MLFSSRKLKIQFLMAVHCGIVFYYENTAGLV